MGRQEQEIHPGNVCRDSYGNVFVVTSVKHNCHGGSCNVKPFIYGYTKEQQHISAIEVTFLADHADDYDGEWSEGYGI